ncbi:hypothetical protein BSKO_05177 [Bryopsis sp. KO-2023]|nr:hypothetical protein BSKO_05177 [Bryopsis sp. KO-2023]
MTRGLVPPGSPVRRTSLGGESIPDASSFEVLTSDDGYSDDLSQTAGSSRGALESRERDTLRLERNSHPASGSSAEQGAPTFLNSDVSSLSLPTDKDIVDKSPEDEEEDYQRGKNTILSLFEAENDKKEERRDLSVFITQLKARQLDGEELVDFPTDYNRIVEKMILEKRDEYDSLDGWLGPRRFEDLPINALNFKLSTSHPDPKVSKGLREIEELDEELRDKTLEAIIVGRETFPEMWGRLEKTRLKRQKQRVDKALKRERRRRRRAARLRRALKKIENESNSNFAARNMRLGPHARFYTLTSEEEAVVHNVMRRAAEELHRNAFDCDLCSDDEDDRMSSRLSEIDSRLRAYSSHCTPSHFDTSSSFSVVGSIGTGRADGDAFESASRNESANGVKPESEDSLYISLRQDYLREIREEKERNQRLEDLDQTLRGLRTSEFPPKLEEQDLSTLLAYCRLEIEANQVDVVDVGAFDIHELVAGGPSATPTPTCTDHPPL